MEVTRMSGSNATQVWQLEKDETLRLPRRGSGVVARVEHGTVLVTQAGDPDDHVLRAGDAVVLAARGLAVAWALTPAVLTLCHAARAAAPEECGVAA